MNEFNTDDILEAKRRVEEMRHRSQGYIEEDTKPTPKPKSSQPAGVSDLLKDFTSLFSNSGNDSSAGLILALILILSKEGADSKLILALLYILL